MIVHVSFGFFNSKFYYRRNPNYVHFVHYLFLVTCWSYVSFGFTYCFTFVPDNGNLILSTLKVEKLKIHPDFTN